MFGQCLSLELEQDFADSKPEKTGVETEQGGSPGKKKSSVMLVM